MGETYDMASYRGFWRLSVGWCLLLCVFQTVEASTIIPVNLPTSTALVEGATSSSITSGALELGKLLDKPYISNGATKIGIDNVATGSRFGLSKISGNIKNGLKLNPGQALLAATTAALVAGVGWIMEEGVLVKKPTGGSTLPLNNDGSFWKSTWGISGGDPSAVCTSTIASYNSFGHSVTFSSLDDSHCYFSDHGSIGLFGLTHCAKSTSDQNDPCYMPSTTSSPLTDSDYDSLDSAVASKDSDFVKRLMHDYCSGSASVGVSTESCYQSMRDNQKVLTGPASVSAPGQSTTTTVSNPDGTTSSVTNNTTTTYNLTYTTNSIISNKTSTTTTTKDGQPQAIATTTEDSTTPEEQPDDKTTPVPCSADCAGPEYADLYTPTTDTKESFIDKYKNRVSNIPLITAGSSFFNVSVGSTCPIWQYHTTVNLYVSSMPIDLVFDYHCQPWFSSTASFASTVMLIVCSYLAFRQAFLD